MENLFLKILGMSATASLVIVVVLLARLLLRRAPKVFSYALWAVVLFRLLCPFAIQSPWSVAPSIQVEPANEGLPAVEIDAERAEVIVRVDDPPADGADWAPPVLAPGEVENIEADRSTPKKIAEPSSVLIAACVWLAGAALLLGYSLVSLLRLRRKLVVCVLLAGERNVRLADHIPSPFVLGLVRPNIYLPSDLPESERDYILLHERTHIRRGDHIFRALAWLALSIHWFNPLVWLAFHLAGKDMEMSCDEAVLRKMGGDIRADYSSSLLRLSTGKRLPAGPLAFGGGNPKSRIKNVLSYKKPTLWVIIAALIAVVCAGVALATDRSEPDVSGPGKPADFVYHEPGPVEVWVDYLSAPEKLSWDGSEEMELPEFPGVTFRWTAGEVSAVTEQGELTLFSGMPVWSVYLCDITGDGCRELCATVSIGSGMVDTRIRVFNYRYLSLLELQDRGVHDYTLKQVGSELWAVEWDYLGGPDLWVMGPDQLGDAGLRSGPLVMTESGLDIKAGAPAASGDGLTANLTLSMDMTGEEPSVRIDGSVGDVVLERGAFWSPPHLFEEYPCGWLHMIYPALTSSGIEGLIWAGWTDDSHTAVTLSTKMMVMLSSQFNVGWLELTVDLDSGAVVERNGLSMREGKPDAETLFYPESISDEEAVKAARVIAKLLTAAEDYYNNYDYSVSDVPASPSPEPSPAPAVTPAQEEGPLPFNQPLTMEFHSGAGGWCTELVLNPDGSFEGDYYDTDMGVSGEGYDSTEYVCRFHGRFGEIDQVTDASWSLVLEELELDTGHPIGEEWIERVTYDGGSYHVRYVSSGPYGFSKWEGESNTVPLEPGAKFTLYSPDASGKPDGELYGAENQSSDLYGFWSWWPNRYAISGGSGGTLGCWGLHNIEGRFGFFSQ